MSIGFAITGPKPPPGALYRLAHERALRELETRADQQPCTYCGSGLYADTPTPCPACA